MLDFSVQLLHLQQVANFPAPGIICVEFGSLLPVHVTVNTKPSPGWQPNPCRDTHSLYCSVIPGPSLDRQLSIDIRVPADNAASGL